MAAACDGCFAGTCQRRSIGSFGAPRDIPPNLPHARPTGLSLLPVPVCRWTCSRLRRLKLEKLLAAHQGCGSASSTSSAVRKTCCGPARSQAWLVLGGLAWRAPRAHLLLRSTRVAAPILIAHANMCIARALRTHAPRLRDVWRVVAHAAVPWSSRVLPCCAVFCDFVIL